MFLNAGSCSLSQIQETVRSVFVFYMESSPLSSALHAWMGHLVSIPVLTWRTYCVGYRMLVDHRSCLG